MDCRFVPGQERLNPTFCNDKHVTRKQYGFQGDLMVEFAAPVFFGSFRQHVPNGGSLIATRPSPVSSPVRKKVPREKTHIIYCSETPSTIVNTADKGMSVYLKIGFTIRYSLLPGRPATANHVLLQRTCSVVQHILRIVVWQSTKSQRENIDISAADRFSFPNCQNSISKCSWRYEDSLLHRAKE